MEQPGGDGQAGYERRCGVMTAAPAETCSVPGVRDAWQMWRAFRIDFTVILASAYKHWRASLFKIRYHALAVSAASVFM